MDEPGEREIKAHTHCFKKGYALINVIASCWRALWFIFMGFLSLSQSKLKLHRRHPAGFMALFVQKHSRRFF